MVSNKTKTFYTNLNEIFGTAILSLFFEIMFFQFKCFQCSLNLASEECTSVHETICNAK